MRVAAGVAEFAQLAMQATPGQLRKCRKPLAQIALKRRDLARPWRPRAIQRRLQASLDVFVHRLAVEPHLAGNRRDAQALPMQFKDHHHLPKSDQRRASRMESRHHQTSADRPPQAPLNSPGENSIGTFGDYSVGTHRCGSQWRTGRRSAAWPQAQSPRQRHGARHRICGAQQATSSSAASLPGHEGW